MISYPHDSSCTVMISPAISKRKQKIDQFGTLVCCLLIFLFAPGIALPVINSILECDPCHQAGIDHTRAYALFNSLQAGIIGRDDGWNARVVAVVEQLEKVLVGPG